MFACQISVVRVVLYLRLLADFVGSAKQLLARSLMCSRSHLCSIRLVVSAVQLPTHHSHYTARPITPHNTITDNIHVLPPPTQPRYQQTLTSQRLTSHPALISARRTSPQHTHTHYPVSLQQHHSVVLTVPLSLSFSLLLPLRDFASSRCDFVSSAQFSRLLFRLNCLSCRPSMFVAAVCWRLPSCTTDIVDCRSLSVSSN